MKKTLLAAALAGLAMPAAANEFEPQIRAYLDSDIAAWVADPTIIAAVQAQMPATGACPSPISMRWIKPGGPRSGCP